MKRPSVRSLLAPLVILGVALCGGAHAQVAVVGSYEKQENAEVQRRKVEQALGVTSEVRFVEVNGRPVYRVIAHAHVDHLRTVGYPDAWRPGSGTVGTAVEPSASVAGTDGDEGLSADSGDPPPSLVLIDRSSSGASSAADLSLPDDGLDPLPPLPDLPELPPWPDVGSALPELRRVEMPESGYNRQSNSRLEAVDFILDQLDEDEGAP